MKADAGYAITVNLPPSPIHENVSNGFCRWAAVRFWLKAACLVGGVLMWGMSCVAGARGGGGANSFVTVEGRGVGVTESGDIWYDVGSTDPIRVTARSGWLVNGRESVTLDPSSGTVGGLDVTSRLQEDSQHIHVFPCVTDNAHARDIVISAQADPSRLVAMYAVPDVGTVVSASASKRVVTKGLHHVTRRYSPCACGESMPGSSCEEWDEEVVPDRYEWVASAAGQTFGLPTWTGTMTKGLGQAIDFRVTGKRDACTACACQAHATAEVDVHELSIERPDYLGLDLTDAMRGRYVTRTATAKIDPEPTRVAYNWTNCGRCVFIDATDGANVTYGGTDKTGASASFLAEPLTVSASVWNGTRQSATAACTTNFTVVAVDVSLKNFGEPMDERNGTIIGTYVKRDGTGWFDGYPDLAKEAMIQCPVKVKVFPEGLPEKEKVALVFEDKNLIVNEKPKTAKNHYSIRRINRRKFYLFNETGTPTSKKVEAKHEDSSARDIVKYDVCCCTFTIYSDASELFVNGKWNVPEIIQNVTITPGHAFCKIDIDAEHKKLVDERLKKYIGLPYGFYPHDESAGFYDVPSDFHREDKHFKNVVANKIGTASYVWHISFEGCIKGLERMHEIETTKPNYDLLCFNCTDAAVSIGRACSAPVPGAGIPDLSALESIRGGLNGDTDWAQSIWNLWKDSDGSYSSPLSLMWNLNIIKKMYGEKE